MAKIATQPCVYISIHGGRKKIHKQKFVYLRDKDEFDIELSNPTKETVLAKIELNGKLISNSGLVLKPGENFVLKRFIDDNGKFVFNTYDIDGSDSDMINAIEDNGKIKVEFYKEISIQPYCNHIPFNIHPYYYPVQPQYYPILPNQPYCTSNTSSIYNLDNIATDSTFSSIETGRIEAGSSTDQTFEYINMDFETFSSYTSELIILPENRKPIRKSDLNKIFCHKCGRKAKQKDNFCSDCGTQLNK